MIKLDEDMTCKHININHHQNKWNAQNYFSNVVVVCISSANSNFAYYLTRSIDK